MEFQDMIVQGVSLAAVVYVVVNQAKRVGLPSRWAGIAALVAGVFFVGMYNAAQVYPVLEPVVNTLVLGLSVGAVAMGLHGSNGVKGEDKGSGA